MSPPSTPSQQTHPPTLPIHQRHLTDPSLDFSPSKARLHQQTSQSWSQALAWLSNIYSSTPSTDLHPHPTHLVPQIERNEATLSALQELMNANLRANQSRKTLHEARIQQLRLYEEHSSQTTTHPSQILLRELKDALPDSARDELHAIASTAVTLGSMPRPPSESSCTSSIITTLGALLIDLTQNLFTAQNDLSALLNLRHEFEEELIQTRRHISDLQLQNNSDNPPQAEPLYLSDPSTTQPCNASKPSHLPGPSSPTIPSIADLKSQTANFQISTKHLLLKIGEYEKRISALRPPSPSTHHDSLHQHPHFQSSLHDKIKIEALQHKQKLLQTQRIQLNRLETKLARFNGLPPDVEASRTEVQRAQNELEEWRRRREEMFEEIGGTYSPGRRGKDWV